MSRRTEMAYKAQSPGKSAQHDKAPDSGDRVNAAVVLRQFTFLSLGGLSGMWYDIVSSEITGRGCRLPNAPAQTMESRSGCGKAEKHLTKTGRCCIFKKNKNIVLKDATGEL